MVDILEGIRKLHMAFSVGYGDKSRWRNDGGRVESGGQLSNASGLRMSGARSFSLRKNINIILACA